MKVLFFVCLFLATTNYGYAQMPVDDLDRDPSLSEQEKDLMRQVRANAKAQLSSFEVAFLVDAAQSLDSCFFKCKKENNGGAACPESCAEGAKASGLTLAAEHQHGNVKCTETHVH